MIRFNLVSSSTMILLGLLLSSFLLCWSDCLLLSPAAAEMDTNFGSLVGVSNNEGAGKRYSEEPCDNSSDENNNDCSSSAEYESEEMNVAPKHEEVDDVGGQAQDAPMRRTKRYPEHLDPNSKIAFYPFWLRIGECPVSSDGLRQYFCPSPTPSGKWVCIDDYELCNGMKNCPNAEDESSTYCMFFKSLKSEVELLTRTVSALSAATAGEGEVVKDESVQQQKKKQPLPIAATIQKYENVKFPWNDSK